MERRIKLCKDRHKVVRAQVAEILVNYETMESLKMLLYLTRDRAALVRTEAYDSLSEFHNVEVEKHLENAILKEKNSMARSYAILSWADVVISIKETYFEDISFIESILSFERSTECIVSCLYAKYKFGDEDSLAELLKYLKDKDYHIRCSVINLLYDILNNNNRRMIKQQVEAVTRNDNAIAVQDSAEAFLKINF